MSPITTITRKSLNMVAELALWISQTPPGFQSKLFVVPTRDPNDGLEPGRLASCLPQQMWISKGEYELFFKVLIRHFLCSWQSAKTPGGGSFGHPRQERCLSHTLSAQ